MISRSRTILSPGYMQIGSVKFHVRDNIKVDPTFENLVIPDALLGDVDEVVADRMIKFSCNPLYYDPSVTAPTIFPWISMAATPRGTSIFSTSNVTAQAVGSNGDTVEAMAAAVTKMPNIFLGVRKDFYASSLEVTGINVSGDDPGTSHALETTSVGNSFSMPAVPGTSTLGRQKYTAAWGTETGFTSFEGFEGFLISHELKLNWIKGEGQSLDCVIDSYRCMAEVIASQNTMLQMLAAMGFDGSGAAQGQQGSAISADLVITGATSVTATLGTAFLKQGGFNFDGKLVRQGGIQFVSSYLGGTHAALVLA